MKYNNLFIAAFLLGASSAIRVERSSGEEATVDGQMQDLDALMDKYDTQEQNKNKPKPQTVTKNGVTVSKGEVQDMELKILTGNNLEESSKKAYDDDLFNSAIEKHSTPDKENKNSMILTKENA